MPIPAHHIVWSVDPLDPNQVAAKRVLDAIKPFLKSKKVVHKVIINDWITQHCEDAADLEGYKNSTNEPAMLLI